MDRWSYPQVRVRTEVEALLGLPFLRLVVVPDGQVCPVGVLLVAGPVCGSEGSRKASHPPARWTLIEKRTDVSHM